MENVITKAFFDEAFELHDIIVNDLEASKSYEELCLELNGQCFILGPLKFWSFNSTLYYEEIITDEDLQKACTRSVFPGKFNLLNTQNKHYNTSDGTQPVFEEIFGNYEVKDGRAAAQAFTQSYVLQNQAGI